MIRNLTFACMTLTAGLISWADEPRTKTSSYVSQMIQEGFRLGDVPPPWNRVEQPPSAETEAKVILPDMRINAGPRIQASDFVVHEPPAPVLGTGITEFKGRRCTLKLRRLLFIPIAFKVEW